MYLSGLLKGYKYFEKRNNLFYLISFFHYYLFLFMNLSDLLKGYHYLVNNKYFAKKKKNKTQNKKT